MSASITLDPNDDYGHATAADTVRLERLLPGPVERVWRYLTEPALRAQWLASGPMDLRNGGAVELEFRNNELSAGDDDAPPPAYEGVAKLYRMKGRVLACEPNRLLVHTWSEESASPSEVRFELTPQGDKVLLVITHSRLARREGMLSVSAGWHTHVALLIARLEGVPPPAFWRTFKRLEAAYAQRLG